MSKETELAWAAGFWDGEGHCGFYQKAGYRNITADLQQTELGPLKRFQDAVGLGKIYGPYRRKNNSQRPYWQFRVTSIGSVKHLFDLLKPYLSEVKEAQFRVAIDKFVTFRKAA